MYKYVYKQKRTLGSTYVFLYSSEKKRQNVQVNHKDSKVFIQKKV
jgi:hypothetical protein